MQVECIISMFTSFPHLLLFAISGSIEFLLPPGLGVCFWGVLGPKWRGILPPNYSQWGRLKRSARAVQAQCNYLGV